MAQTSSPIIGLLRFSADEDLLRFEPKLEELWPRTDKKTGATRNDWDVQHRLAMEEIERRMRSTKATAEPIELGRLGIRTKTRLIDCAACFALHYIFVAADTHGDATGYFKNKAAYYLEKATDILAVESEMMDYDMDNNGTVDFSESNQPMPTRFIRG